MRILLVCFGGWSSSILGKRIQQSMQARGHEADVTTAPVELGLGQLASFDVTLVAPQVRHMVSTVEKAADKVGKPVLAISMQEFAATDASALADRILAATSDK